MHFSFPQLYIYHFLVCYSFFPSCFSNPAPHHLFLPSVQTQGGRCRSSYLAAMYSKSKLILWYFTSQLSQWSNELEKLQEIEL